MDKDPYYTYTDYWPCKPARKDSWALLLLVVVVLAVVVYFGAIWY